MRDPIPLPSPRTFFLAHAATEPPRRRILRRLDSSSAAVAAARRSSHPTMAANVGESTSGSSSGGADSGGSFECNICFELPQEPIVTLCGHLFCWPCLYKWLHIHSHSPECPVCKALVEEDKLVPLYGRGKDRVDPRSKNVPGADIPNRPAGQRPATAPQANPNTHFPNANPNPWFMGGGIPLANARWGNYTFSAAFGGLFPLLSFQVHGFPDATAYGQPAGFPYGYGHGHGHGHAFHGGHAHAAAAAPRHGPPGQQQQADVYLKALLILVGFLVIASLITF
uniref:E3 ubiquitin-protein ligase RMA n=1 Tax=Oryza punctata TaxID=4537 RepID=A0A0E0MQ09_ORYPU